MPGTAHFNKNDLDGASATRRRVLIVEDNLLNMKLFCALLESQGYEVIEAGDGTRGLELARRADPDLILMDIHLPDISGLELTRMLKADAATSWIPVIATTAYAMLGAENALRESGCDAYMAKPIAITPFLELIDQMLKRVPSKAEPPTAIPA